MCADVAVGQLHPVVHEAFGIYNFHKDSNLTSGIKYILGTGLTPSKCMDNNETENELLVQLWHGLFKQRQ